MKIKHYFFALAALLFCRNANAVNDDPTDNAHFGYIENKGQIHDQNGNARSDVRYLYYNDQFKLQLRSGGFSYEFVKSDYTSPYNTESGLRKEDKDENATEFNWQYTVNRVDVDFVNANKNVQVVSEGASPSYRNYFNQYTGYKGITQVHSFNSVTYQNIYNGIDLVFSSEKNIDGKIYPKYEFIVHPNGNIADIALSYKGDFDFSIVNEGDLKITTGLGYVQETQPVILFSDGRSTEKGKFIRHGSTVSFSGVKKQGIETITIDPTIEWGTYWGGTQKDLSDEIATDHQNNIYVTGRTRSSSGVATAGAYITTLQGGLDVPIMKWNPDGTLEWATYYGGVKNEIGFCATVDPSDNVWIGGHTFSSEGIATPGAMQETYGGVTSTDFGGLLAKFSSAGSLLYGTYFGGRGENEFQNIWSDDAGNIYGNGLAESLDSIVYSTCYSCVGDTAGDIIIMKFDNDGHQLWANYWGGKGGRDRGHGITTSGNNLYVCGTVESATGIASGTPTGNGFNTVFQGGGSDMWLGRWDKTTGVPIWNTYFGGTGGERGRDIRCDRDGSIYFVAQTESGNGLATAGAWKESFVYTQDNRDALIGKFDSNCNKIAATYFGADGIEMPRSLRVGYEGAPVYIGGYTKSTSGFVTSDAVDKVNKKNNDAFWARLNWNLTTLQYCTYYGGKKAESVTEPGWYGPTMDLDGNNNVYVSTGTNSSDGIVYGNAYDTTLAGDYDFCLAKFPDPCPDGFEPNDDFSTSTLLRFRGETTITRYAPLQVKKDKDYYVFNTPAGMNNLKVTLSDLPLNYNLYLYDSSQIQISKSINTGTTSEAITENGTYTGRYYVQVKGKSALDDWADGICYKLDISVSNQPFRMSEESALGTISLFPNPANQTTSLLVDCNHAGFYHIYVCDLQGRIIIPINQQLEAGTQTIELPIQDLSSGTYLVKVNGSGANDVVKLMVQK